MKKIIILICMIFLLVSCEDSKSEDEYDSNLDTFTSSGNTITNGDLPGNNIEITATGTISIENRANLISNINGNIENSSGITLTEFIDVLPSIDTTTETLIAENNNLYLEEIPWITEYGTSNANYEYYMLKALSDDNINECDNIRNEAERKICNSFIDNLDNKDLFVEEYVSNGEEKYYAENMYTLGLALKNKTCTGLPGIQYYLMCKKILDSRTDAMQIFINYSILEIYMKSNYVQNVFLFYNDLADFWGYDQGFKDVVKNTLLDNNR